MLLLMETYDLLVVALIKKEELKCITTLNGVQFVMTSGITWMLKLYADSYQYGTALTGSSVANGSGSIHLQCSGSETALETELV